jgi:hypothetical protein
MMAYPVRCDHETVPPVCPTGHGFVSFTGWRDAVAPPSSNLCGLTRDK